MRKLSIVAGLAVALFVVPAAKADQIDRTLVRNADDITKAVRSLGGERVAVLKFDVTVGGKPSEFQAGLANVKLAQKIENLLILTNDPKAPLFILSDAGVAASKLPAKTTWRDAEGRKALCGLKGLPLAWDDSQKLTPDSFITGELQIDADYKSAKIVIYGFTAAKPEELKTLYTTPKDSSNPAKPGIVTDRGFLALAGVSFALGNVPKNRGDGDKNALFQAASKTSFGQTAAQSPIKLQMIVDEKPVAPQTDSAYSGNGSVQLQLPDPTKGSTVSFRLENPSKDKTYGVLLAVNGRNTNSLDKNYNLDSKDAKDHRLWILGPGEKVSIKGFYTDAKTGDYDPFKVIDNDKSPLEYSMMSGEFRGLITMHVFGERTEPTSSDTGLPKTSGPTDPTSPVNEEVELSVVSLGVGGTASSEVRSAGSLDKAKKKMEELAGVRTAPNGALNPDPEKVSKTEKGLIVPSESRQLDGKIEAVQFKMDTNCVAFLQIRYYTPTR